MVGADIFMNKMNVASWVVSTGRNKLKIVW